MVGSKRAPGHHRHPSLAPPGHHRDLRHGAARRLRPRGVRHPRHEGDAPRRSSADRASAAGTAPTSSTPSSCCGPTVPGSRVAEVPVTVEETSTVPHADPGPGRCAPSSAWCACASRCGETLGGQDRRMDTARREPLRGRAVRAPGGVARGRRGRGRDHRGVRRRRPRSASCASRRRTSSARMDDLAFALGNLLTPRALMGATAVAVIGGPREVEDGPAVSVFAAVVPRTGAHARRRSASSTRPTARRSPGWPELDDEPTTLILLADPFTFPTDGVPPHAGRLAPGRRPPDAPGSRSSAARRRRREVRAATASCSTAGSRPGRGRRVRRRGRGADGRLAGLPAGRAAVRDHPRRGQPDRGARRDGRRSSGCRTARPRSPRKTAC